MKFLILHGSFGSADGNWFPRLKESLEVLDQEVVLPQFPTDNWDDLTKRGKDTKPEYQTLSNWLDYFERDVLPEIKDDELCLVAHSLGPLFALHMIDKFEIKLDSAIFVSPFLYLPYNEKHWQIDVANQSFYGKEFDFEKLQKLIPLSYVLYSDNDPYVDKEYAKEFAQKLDSSVIQVMEGEHMGGNLNEFPLVLELCKSRIPLSLYQKYVAYLNEHHPLEIVKKGKDRSVILPASELVKEGTFHFQNLQKGGFCTLPYSSSTFWDTQKKYFKEGRKAAKRVPITRVFIINSEENLKEDNLKKMMDADKDGGIKVFYVLRKNIENKVYHFDFGIWDEDYTCTVFDDEDGVRFEINSSQESVREASDSRDTIMKYAKKY